MSSVPAIPDGRGPTRLRIVEAAARLLQAGGAAAVTTRAAAEAAGVQAPAIYRLFGDKDGLLEAVAEHVMAAHVAAKATALGEEAATGADPVEDLRRAWRAQVEFGLANPALFRLLSDPSRVRSSPAAGEGRRVLAGRVHRVDAAGRLRVAESVAVDAVAAAGVGVIQTALAAEPGAQDPGLADLVLEAVLARVLTDAEGPEEDRAVASAVTLLAASDGLDLTTGERALLREWLERMVGRASADGASAG